MRRKALCVFCSVGVLEFFYLVDIYKISTSCLIYGVLCYSFSTLIECFFLFIDLSSIEYFYYFLFISKFKSIYC